MRVVLTALAALFALTAPAFAASPDLVVSQVYGGGGNTGAPYTHDYIEVFNRRPAAVSLNGKSLQYGSATGTGNLGANATQLTELPDVMLQSGHYFLVQEGAGAGNGVALPTPGHVDPTPIAMAAGAGKVAIVSDAATLGCNGGSNPCGAAQLARIIDLVGYGNANFFEGTGAAPTLTNSTAGFRARGGWCDTDDNAADFSAGSAAPRNGEAVERACEGDRAPSVASSEPATGASDVALDADIDVTFSEPVDLTSAFALACETSGAHAVAVTGGPTSYTLDPAGSFARAESCTLTVDADGVHDQDPDDPPDTMASDAVIVFTTVGEEIPIHAIQGPGHISPYAGRLVSNVPGVVTARRGNGFFIQDPQPDTDLNTSEGIFVFTSSTPPATAKVGDAVLVSGRVTEFRGAANALGLTEITGPTVKPAGAGAPIAPTLIGAGGRIPPGEVIDNDSFGVVDASTPFDPDQDGIDFYESMEGMLVRVNDALAVGPTSSFGETPVVADGGRSAGPRTARGGVIITPDDFNPERMHLDDEVLQAMAERMPAADVRDGLGDVEAVIDYSFGNFKLQLTAVPTVTDGGLEKEVTEPPDSQELAVGSFNVENLTPLNLDSPAQRTKYAALAHTLVVNMQAPDIVAVEEIQDNDGTTGTTTSTVTDASQTWQALIAAIQAAGGPSYDFRQIDPVAHQDGGAPGGNIRVGFLFRTDRGLEFVDRPGGTSTNATDVVDTPDGPRLTYSPGRIEPADVAWQNSRKPLAGEFRWRGRTLIVVANHFASKGGDDPLFGQVQPPVRSTEVQRHRQAAVVNAFAQKVLAADTHAPLIVLGDLNDFEFSETVQILEGDELVDLMDDLPKPERYSYVFEGNSQVLDQILVSRTLTAPKPEYDSVHMNAEFADQTSDHDPQVARFHVTGRRSDDG